MLTSIMSIRPWVLNISANILEKQKNKSVKTASKTKSEIAVKC